MTRGIVVLCILDKVSGKLNLTACLNFRSGENGVLSAIKGVNS